MRKTLLTVEMVVLLGYSAFDKCRVRRFFFPLFFFIVTLLIAAYRRLSLRQRPLRPIRLGIRVPVLPFLRLYSMTYFRARFRRSCLKGADSEEFRLAREGVLRGSMILSIAPKKVPAGS